MGRGTQWCLRVMQCQESNPEFTHKKHAFQSFELFVVPVNVLFGVFVCLFVCLVWENIIGSAKGSLLVGLGDPNRILLIEPGRPCMRGKHSAHDCLFGPF